MTIHLTVKAFILLCADTHLRNDDRFADLLLQKGIVSYDFKSEVGAIKLLAGEGEQLAKGLLLDEIALVVNRYSV
ncbi:MAG: hypothetical protein AAB871_04005, partial [Patescibacteria group bacterium]